MNIKRLLSQLFIVKFNLRAQCTKISLIGRDFVSSFASETFPKYEYFVMLLLHLTNVEMMSAESS